MGSSIKCEQNALLDCRFPQQDLSNPTWMSGYVIH